MERALTHPEYAERRQTARVDVELPAVIEMNCRPKVPCTVTDISLIGAMLKVDRKVYLTGTFDLVLAGCPLLRCTLKHRLLDRAGVAFLVPLTGLPGA
jgi:hypothetical protein